MYKSCFELETELCKLLNKSLTCCTVPFASLYKVHFLCETAATDIVQAGRGQGRETTAALIGCFRRIQAVVYLAGQRYCRILTDINF